MTGEARYWDSQADTFDHQPDHGLLDPPVRQAWRRLLLAELPPAPAAIADLGCGTGTLSVLLAAEGYAVTGLDFAPQMIRAARAKARAAGVSARFELSNAAAPTLPAASFDVVLARHVLWAMPDTGAALAAWLRLLLPGGTLLLIEGRWSTGSDGPGVGLTAREAGRAVLRQRSDATITVLDDPALWGAPVTDERYLLISRR
jgi:ubiquinone/menaquinone biosynthesis C-methylase UbiE